MNRKMIGRLIVGLLILATMITGGCAAPKLGISIKIEATTSTWRTGEQPYDIYGAIKHKLGKVGFEVVPEDSTDYDAILYVDYREEKGASYSPSGHGTDIICDLRLVDKAQSTILETEIEATTLYETSGPLYSDALFMFKTKPYFEYLGEIIAHKFGVEGAEAVESLIQALNDEDVRIRAGAAEALGEMGDAGAVEPLIQALQDEDENNWVQREAAEALGKIGDERAIEPLIQALEDKDEDVNVRMEAAKALGEIGGARVVEDFIQALNDADASVRQEAAQVLGAIGDASATEPLIQALNDEDEHVREAAKEALVKIGEPAVEPLIQALKDEDEGLLVRTLAAIVLGEIGDERAIEPLTQALEDEGEGVRYAAQKALEKIRGY